MNLKTISLPTNQGKANKPIGPTLHMIEITIILWAPCDYYDSWTPRDRVLFNLLYIYEFLIFISMVHLMDPLKGSQATGPLENSPRQRCS